MSILLWTTLWAVNFSLLFFFRRLFNSATSLRSAWLFWYIMTGITASTLIVTVFLLLISCGTPANYFIYGKDYAVFQFSRSSHVAYILHLCYRFELLITSSPQYSGACQKSHLLNLNFLFSAGTDIAGRHPPYVSFSMLTLPPAVSYMPQKADNPPATLRWRKKQTH